MRYQNGHPRVPVFFDPLMSLQLLTQARVELNVFCAGDPCAADLSAAVP